MRIFDMTLPLEGGVLRSETDRYFSSAVIVANRVKL